MYKKGLLDFKLSCSPLKHTHVFYSILNWAIRVAGCNASLVLAFIQNHQLQLAAVSDTACFSSSQALSEVQLRAELIQMKCVSTLSLLILDQPLHPFSIKQQHPLRLHLYRFESILFSFKDRPFKTATQKNNMIAAREDSPSYWKPFFSGTKDWWGPRYSATQYLLREMGRESIRAFTATLLVCAHPRRY